MVWFAAASLGIYLLPLPSYSPDLMAVEPLWRWLREDVTYHHCHATAEDLIRRVAAFEADVNADPCAVADRLWVKDHPAGTRRRLRTYPRNDWRETACAWPGQFNALYCQLHGAVGVMKRTSS